MLQLIATGFGIYVLHVVLQTIERQLFILALKRVVCTGIDVYATLPNVFSLPMFFQIPELGYVPSRIFLVYVCTLGFDISIASIPNL